MERAKKVCLEAPQRLRVWQELHGGYDPHGSDRPGRLPPIGEGPGGRDEAALQLLYHEHHVVHDVWIQEGGILRKNVCSATD